MPQLRNTAQGLGEKRSGLGAEGWGQLLNPEPRAQSPEPRAGFTLVELLVVMAMVGVVMGALLTSFLIGRKSYLSADAYVQVQQEARRAFDVMVKELREAGGPFLTVAAAPPTAQLNFQIALGYDLDAGAGAVAGCLDQQICWGAVDPTDNLPKSTLCVQYRVVGTQLLREVHNSGGACTGAIVGAARVLANDVDANNISFAYVGGTTKTVTIQLAVQQNSQQLPGGSMSTTPAPLQTRVRLRN